MGKVEREKGLFGTPAISRAWLAAILRHPVAYLQHRSAFMWNFLAADNLAMWTADVEHPTKKVFADRAAFNALVSAHDVLKPTPFLRAGFWLLACIVICGWSWRRSAPREAAFALAVCGSATIYVVELLCRGRGVRLPLWLLGGAGRHRRRRRCYRLKAGQRRAAGLKGLLLRFSRRGPGLVVGIGNARQFLDESRDRPDFVVLGAGLRKAGHARHVDAVLDHPE